MSDSNTHRLILMPSGRQGDVPHGASLLDAARGLGVEIESICGGRQTCGKCLVQPVEGAFPKHGITSAGDHITPAEADERAYAADHGIDLSQTRLSCAACITGDLLVTVPEESQAHKQVIRKEASDLIIEVAPAVRLVYIEVEPAELGGPGDWRRVQTALADQWGLRDTTIDPLVLRDLQKTLRAGNWKATLTLWRDREVIRIEPGYVESLYGLAVDIGSTTIAAYLCDLRTGQVAATRSMMNPQVRYGEDLMSRISYGMMEPQGVSRLHRAVIGALNDLAGAAAQSAGIDSAAITDLVLVGNTVMHHLLLGIDPVELGAAPFALAVEDAVDMKARDLGLKAVHPAAMIHILPCIAGHVGADNVGVLLAELPHFGDDITLVVDIGTNAEMLLGGKGHILSASSPTGPAFEGAQIQHGQRAAPGAIERVRIGGQNGAARFKVVGDDRWSDEFEAGQSPGATGICGSGIIEAVAELFTAGLIDSGGLFYPDADRRHPRVRFAGRTAEFVLAAPEETASGKAITVTQQDVRAIQLAKGALYAGVRLLMDHLGVETVGRVRLAGAFGNYIDPKHAMLIGLIPDCDLAHVQAIGNAAGDGARIALLNAAQREVAAQAAREVEYVETAVEPRFQEHFVDAMALPHASASYPHLAGLLPDPQPSADPGDPKRGRRRNRMRSSSSS